MNLALFTLGNKPPDTRQLTLLLSLIAVLTAALYIPLLEQPQLYNEETRRALIAEHMMITGDYWVPLLQERIYTAKPPLYNWLIVAASWPQGVVDAFSSRIVSVISHGLLALMMVWGLRRRLSVAGLAFLGAALVLAPEFARKALSAEIESLFTLLVSASIWSWFWLDQRGARKLQLWLPPALLVALAFLTKREPGLVFYYFSIAAYLLSQRRFGELFHWPHLLCATLTLAIIALWPLQVIDQIGLDAFINNTLMEVVQRGTEKDWSSYLKHLMSYPLQILLAIFPFSLLLIALISRSVRDRLNQRQHQLYLFCMLAIAANLPIYLFRGEVSVRYFMPMMPTLLVLAALVFDDLRRTDTPAASRWFVFISRFSAVVTGLMAALTLLLLFPDQLGLKPRPPHLLAEPVVFTLAVGALLAALMLLPKAWRQGRRYALASLILMMLVLRVLYFDVLLPHKVADLKNEENYPGWVETVYATVPKASLPIKTYGWTPHAFWYYMEYGDVETLKPAIPAQSTPPLQTPSHSAPPAYLVLMRAAVDGLQKQGYRVQELSSLPLKIGDLILVQITPES